MTWLPDQAIARLQAIATWPEFEADRYTVLEEIGRGGMGTVYLARDEALGREVAIKVSSAVASPPQHAQDPRRGPRSEALEQRIQNEARILAELEHPGIVPIHDAGRLVDGRLFYVMKRVRGHTLRDWLASAAPGDALRVFERICDPVAFAHAHGCIHRDLKPENVMVGAFGEVMVMDWGVAKNARTPAPGGITMDPTALNRPADDGLTGAGTVLGTPGYMAPEQASGHADTVDVRADVYGLGAILFMLLTGEPPPAEAGAAAARMAHRESEVPRALQAICARALAPVPADRYPTVEALAADVARYRAGQAVDAHRETLVERTARFARTYRTPILLVLAYMIMRAIVAFTAGR